MPSTHTMNAQAASLTAADAAAQVRGSLNQILTLGDEIAPEALDFLLEQALEKAGEAKEAAAEVEAHLLVLKATRS